jgi:hypothetical protein
MLLRRVGFACLLSLDMARLQYLRCFVGCFAQVVRNFTLLHYRSTPLVGRPPPIGLFHASLMHNCKAARLRPLRTREDFTSTPWTPSSPCSYAKVHVASQQPIAE